MSSSIDKVKQLLSGEWFICSKLNQNKVLDLNSQNVILNDKDPSKNTQKWTVSYDNSSSIGRAFIIKNKSVNDYFLTDDGGNAMIHDVGVSYGDVIYQRWYFYYQDDGSFIIANYVGDYLNPSVLDVAGASTNNGTNILSYSHSGIDNQRFYLVSANSQ